MKKCYIYTRVSTIAQVDGYSLEAQAERLREYAIYKDLDIVGEYCDAGKSGKSIKGRPEFQQMLDDIVSQKDDISFVLVFKLSRFGRNAADVLKSLQLLMDYGIDLVCVEDAIDSSTQGGRLTLAILSAVAEIERENINVQFFAGKMQKLNDGGWVGGLAPYGYRMEKKELVLVPEEAKIVKLIYDKYLEDDMTLNSLVNYLNENGYRKVFKGNLRPFQSNTVKTILNNPVYCGEIIYNRRTNDKSSDRKPKEIICVKGIHEPIVSKEQWEAVQRKREIRKVKNEKVHDLGRVPLLSGLVKCPKCGAGMVSQCANHINHNKGGYYKTMYHYVCINHRKTNGRICDFRHTNNQEKVDSAVLEIISNLKFHPSFQKQVVEQLGSQEDMDKIEEELKKSRKLLHSEEMKKRKLGDCLDDLDILDDDYDEKYEKIQMGIDDAYDKIEKIELEIEKKMKKLSALQQGMHTVDKIIILLDHVKDLYEHMSGEERRRLFRLMIEKIEVYPEEMDRKIIKSISFKFPVYYEEEPVSAKKEPDEQILFTLDCSKSELTASEAKATYSEIKTYILEKYGVKVSTLYIAQIKRKYGLDMGIHYNVSKKEDSRVPKCPKEKEVYIVEALKYYKMLG